MFILEVEDETGGLNLRAGVAPWLDLGFGYRVDSKIHLDRARPAVLADSGWIF
jgi:hypothetical protein